MAPRNRQHTAPNVPRIASATVAAVGEPLPWLRPPLPPLLLSTLWACAWSVTAESAMLVAAGGGEIWLLNVVDVDGSSVELGGGGVETKAAVEDTMVLEGGGNAVDIAVEDTVTLGGGASDVEEAEDAEEAVVLDADLLDVDLSSSSLSSSSSFASTFLSSSRRRRRRRPARLSMATLSSRLRYLSLASRLLADMLASSMSKS